MAKCNTEQRQINGGNFPPVTVGVNNAQVKIFANPGGITKILSISCQPDADTTLQLFEGGGTSLPMTPNRLISKNSIWSVPGKFVQSDIYLTVGTSGVNIGTMVRYIKQ